MATNLDELFQLIRQGTDLISPEQLSLIVNELHRTKTKTLLVEALEEFQDRTEEEVEWESFRAREFKKEVENDLRVSHYGADIKAEVRNLINERDLDVSPDSPLFKQLCRAVLQAWVLHYEDAALIVKGHLDDPRLYDTGSNIEEIKAPKASGKGVLIFKDSIETYLAEYKRNWTDKHFSSQQAKLNHFLDFIGEGDRNKGEQVALQDVSSSDVRSYKELLQRTPSNASKRHPNKTVFEVAETADSDRNPRLSATSITKYIQCLSSFYTWAMKELDFEGKNPFLGRGVSSTSATSKRAERNPFSRQQLKTLFSSPIFYGCKSLASCYKEGGLIPNDSNKYWVPLIGFYSGMRQQEILQLYLEDIYEHAGIWVMDINENHPDKRLKTPQSKRLVPIHRDLITLGLIDLKNQRSLPEESQRLFSDALMSSDGTYSSTFSKWFSRYLKNVDVKTEKTSFHSFRHNIKDLFRNAGESDEISESFVGRTTGTTGERYGSGYRIERLDTALHQLQFDEFIDVQRLKSRQQ